MALSSSNSRPLRDIIDQDLTQKCNSNQRTGLEYIKLRMTLERMMLPFWLDWNALSLAVPSIPELLTDEWIAATTEKIKYRRPTAEENVTWTIGDILRRFADVAVLKAKINRETEEFLSM